MNRCRPMRLGNRVPRQRSLPSGASGARCQSFSSAACHSSSAASTSWPSAKMSASTAIGRPMMRLAANGPPLTCGVTRSMTTGGRSVAALAARRSCRLPSRTAAMRLTRTKPTSPAASRSGGGPPSIVRGLPSSAPAAGSRGSRLTGIGCGCDGSLLIRTTTPFCAAQPAPASSRARTDTPADASLSRRIGPAAPNDDRHPASRVACLTSASRSVSNPAGIIRPSPVVAASRSARSLWPTSMGPIRMGASTSPMTGAMRRSDSCSSTNQAARPSHQAVEAKTPSNPMPAKSAWRDQLSPGVHAQNPQGAWRRVAPMIFCRASRESGSRPTSRNPAAPARTRPARRSVHHGTSRSTAVVRRVAAALAAGSSRGSTTPPGSWPS